MKRNLRKLTSAGLIVSMIFTMFVTGSIAATGSVSAVRVSGTNSANHQFDIQLVFSGSAIASDLDYSTDQSVNILPDSMTEKILLNGNTLKDIIKYRGNKVISIYFLTTGLRIFFRDDFDYTGYNIKMDGSDYIQVLAGLTTPTGLVTTADATFYYRDMGFDWSTEPIKVDSVSPIAYAGFGSDFVKLTFNQSLNDATNANLNYSKYFISLNGNILANIPATDVVGAWYDGGNRQLGLYYKPTPNQYSFKQDNTDVLTILKGFKLCDGSITRSDISFFYRDGKWVKEVELKSATNTVATYFGGQPYIFFKINVGNTLGTNKPNFPFVKINGVSLADIQASTPEGAPWRAGMWNDGDGIIGIYLLNYSTYSLNFDGTDVVELAPGYVSEDGNIATVSHYLYLNRFGGFGKEAALKTATPVLKTIFTDNNYDFSYLDFGKTLATDIYTNSVNASLVRINGVSIADINATSGAGPWRAAMWQQGNGKLGIYVLQNTPYSLKKDGTDKLEILPGFLTEDNDIIRTTQTLYFYAGAWYKQRIGFGTLKYKNDAQLSNISPFTKISAVIDPMTKDAGTGFKVKNSAGQLINPNDYATTEFGTGTSIEIANTVSDTAIASFTGIVYGDVDGVGGIDVADLALIKGHLLRNNTISSINFTAANIYNQPELTISSLLAVKKSILTIAAIDQNH